MQWSSVSATQKMLHKHSVADSTHTHLFSVKSINMKSKVVESHLLFVKL